MRIGVLLQTLISIVNAIEINYYIGNEDSSLASVNLTELTRCLSHINTSIDIVSVFHEIFDRESHVAVVDEFNDDEQLYSGENQLAIITDIQDCYRKVGIRTNIICARDHEHLARVSGEGARIATQRSNSYSIPGINSRFSQHHLNFEIYDAKSRWHASAGFWDLVCQRAALVANMASQATW